MPNLDPLGWVFFIVSLLSVVWIFSSPSMKSSILSLVSTAPIEPRLSQDRRVSIEQGGTNNGLINTGDIIVNAKVEPKVDIVSVSQWQVDPVHGYRKQYLVQMTNPADMDAVRICVVGDKVSGLDPLVKRSGMIQKGHSGVRGNLHFTHVITLNNFRGFNVYATEPTEIVVEVDAVL